MCNYSVSQIIYNYFLKEKWGSLKRPVVAVQFSPAEKGLQLWRYSLNVRARTVIFITPKPGLPPIEITIGTFSDACLRSVSRDSSAAFYQGLTSVPSSMSLLKNFPVGAFFSVNVCLTIKLAAPSTVPGPLCWLKSVAV